MKTLVLATALVTLPLPAFAQIVVMGDGAPQSCYRAAKLDDHGSRSAIRTCTDALEGVLTLGDRAATHVNRGILLMRKGETDDALDDYDRALKIRPELPEAHINRGAALFIDGEFADSLTAYNRADELGAGQSPDLLYNRALAYEALGDARSAYSDLKAALELRPDWAQAQRAFSRFEVRPASG